MAIHATEDAADDTGCRQNQLDLRRSEAAQDILRSSPCDVGDPPQDRERLLPAQGPLDSELGESSGRVGRRRSAEAHHSGEKVLVSSPERSWSDPGQTFPDPFEIALLGGPDSS